ncbi:MAG: biotin--[acetyl-CoA-carboxylase] ligase, partial [Syntrophorhabdaceae bacterium]|nr:biotin--[acetyl-CoA-carboxylase] ligase [Syntrophorhabdaceae bacterium]
MMIYGRILPGEIKKRLSNGSPWVEIVCLSVTDSTNSRAMELALSGAVHGTVVIADEQACGRGCRGLHWFSPSGRNIYVSLILRPEITNAKAAGLSLAAGVALADAAESVGVSAFLKWPNDLYLGGKKAAGILVETKSDGDALKCAVVGVGVNVNLAEDEIPEELREKATSFAIHAGRSFLREDILAGFLNAFSGRYAEFVAGGFLAI